MSHATAPTPVYFDAAAAAPMHPVARAALLAALDDGWADPGKLYARSRQARHLLDAATAAVADTIGVRPDEISFHPSGTDACWRALTGVSRAREGVGGMVVHSAVEHAAIRDAARAHAGPAGVMTVPVDRHGRIDLAAWTRAVVQPGVAVAALMSANHEVGTAQPVADAATACGDAGVPVVVDAAQSWGRAPVPEGWAILVGSAHKWGGPPGVGVMARRAGVPWEPTDPPSAAVSLPLVVSAAAALRAATAESDEEDARLRPLIDRIRAEVPLRVPDVDVVGDPVDRLPHIVTFSCLYVDGEALLHALDRRGFAVSSGSSCATGTGQPSHVLAAMGALTHGNIRISLHRDSTRAEVDRFLDELPDIVASLRAESGVAGL